MKFDFESIMDRHGKDSIAVDGLTEDGGSMAPAKPQEGFDAIPMWVADMNFPTCPAITDKIIARAQHPAFGYFSPTDEYYQSIIDWHRTRNGVEGMEPKHIGYENGVLGGVISTLNCLASKGDNILIHSPTYIGFTFSLENNGYNIVHSPLVKDENGIYRMDYEDMEKKIIENHIHVAIFCTPHNPTGRVWEKEELEKAIEVYQKHNVWVICDEIWSDLLIDGSKHIPLQSVNDWAHNHVAAFYAPSKTFNLAGLIGAYHVIYNDWLRDREDKESSLSHYNSMNVLSMHALVGAYSQDGHQWVDELNQVLSKNVNDAYDYITTHFEGVSLSKPQGTYMLFLDLEEWCKKHNCGVEDILRSGWKVGVAWQDGRPFHGPYAIRMNLALPNTRVMEAMDRLSKYVFVD